MTITLVCRFHNSSVDVTLLPNGHISSDDLDRAAQELCGMQDCACQPVQLNGVQVVDELGNLYDVD